MGPSQRVRRSIAIALLAAVAVLPSRLAAEGMPTIAQVIEVADIEALAPSPDGRKVAFRVHRASIERNTYGVEWYVADLETGRTWPVADAGAPIYNEGLWAGEAPIWSPDGRFIHHLALIDGAIGIWRSAVDGSGSRLVAGGEADIESLSASPDGRELLYVTGPTRDEVARAERREYDDGILVDATVDLNQNLYHGGWNQGRLVSQRLTGRWYSRAGLLWRSPRTRHRLDLTTLAAGPIEQVPPPATEPMSATRTERAVTVTSPGGEVATLSRANRQTRLEIRRSDGSTILCSAPACRDGAIETMVWRPGRRGELVFSRRDRHHRQSLHIFDAGTGRVRDLAQGDGLMNGGRMPSSPCAITAASAVCVVAGAVSPPRLERIDLDNGRRTQLFDPNAALRARPVPRVEQLEWRLADGRAATGTLLLPRGGDPVRAPLFLNHYYCDGYLRGGVGDEFPFIQLVDAGFVVACLNIVPYEEWGDGIDHYRTALASIEALIELLDRRNLVDPRRVGMGGFSAGSEATMWVATRSDILAAASISSPQYEPSAYWMAAQRGRDFPRVLREFLQAGSPDEDRERWQLLSPALNVERIGAPLLMQLPEQEARAASELHGRLSNTRTPVELYAFPDEAHNKVQPRHRFAVHRRNLDWFRYWLQNHVDSDPERAGQYRRWEELRRRQGNTSE